MKILGNLTEWSIILSNVMQKTLYSARNHPSFSSLSVRKEKNQFYQEHRTDGTDAFDTLYIGCEQFSQNDFMALRLVE